MRVEISATRLTAVPGRPAVLTVQVTNDGSLISGHRVRVLGVDPAWAEVDQREVQLFPGSTGAAVVTITLPTGIPAGARRIDIEVAELTAPYEVAVHPVELSVPAELRLGLSLDPTSSTGGGRADLAVIAENRGNSPIELNLNGVDEDGEVEFEFVPADSTVGPGEQLLVAAHLRAPRPTFGSAKVRSFSVEAGPAGAPVVTQGVWLQRPRMSRGALALVGLLAVATVFAVVLATTLSSVVSSSNANRDLALSVAAASANRNAGAGGKAVLGGTVTILRTGAPQHGVTVDLFTASDVTKPIVSTATASNGGYRFQGLPAGGYKVRFDAAGFSQLWWPDSTTASGAKAVTLGATSRLTDINIHLGGIPVTIAGHVQGNNVGGAVLTLEQPAGSTPSGAVAAASVRGGARPAAILTAYRTGAASGATGAGASGVTAASGVSGSSGASGAASGASGISGAASGASGVSGSSGASGTSGVAAPAGGSGAAGASGASGNSGSQPEQPVIPPASVPVIVATQTLSPSGDFTFANVPSPAVYALVVTKPGYATTTQELDLAGGENRSGLSLQLQEGDASISGAVTSSNGTPLGDAAVTASAGSTTVSTITATTAGRVGDFALSSLPSPDTLTVTVSKAGYASQTLVVTVTANQHLTGVNVVLSPGAGSISGVVTTPAGTPTGGVTVTATNGELTLHTQSLSVARGPAQPIGSYLFTGLKVPSTYTLSFARSDLATQTVAVPLPDAGRIDVTGEDASLQASTAGVSGVVSQDCPAGDTACNANGAPLVTVTLTSGSRSYQVMTASAGQVGYYAIDDVIPGTYTLSFTRPGGVPVSEIVSLAAGQQFPGNTRLAAAASILGYVYAANPAGKPTGPAPGATVDLYLSGQYPTTLLESTTAGSNGAFSFENLDAPQGYVVAVTPPGAQSAQETVTVTTALGQQADVCGQEATGAKVTLSPRSSTTATCTNPLGDPLLVAQG